MTRSESQNIEWKESWRDEYLKWICGFANAQGGKLLIGKNDKGVAVGIPNAKQLLETLPNKVRDLLGIIVDVNLLKEAGKELIEINVSPYPNPISYKGQYHYRSGSTKQELKGAALDRFLLGKQGLHWDGVAVPGFSISDLSGVALDAFRKQAIRNKRLPEEVQTESDEILLEKLRLFQKTYLKRAAVLLFHDEPESMVIGATVKIGYFQSNTDLLYQDVVEGNLFTQVEKTLDLLLTKYLRAGISYEGVYRRETFPLPENALREAIINAIAHKNYASSIPIQISVYPDKLMIWNAGHLPEQWTLEQLTTKHASLPYNPDIANAFFKVAYLESWGRGIELMCTACLEFGSPAPQFRWDNGLWVEFPFRGEKLGERLGEKLGKKVGKTAGAILEAMKENPRISIQSLSTDLNLSTTAIEKSIANLKKQGYLKRIGPAKGGHWQVIEPGRATSGE